MKKRLQETIFLCSTPDQHCVAKPETEAINSVALCKVQTDVAAMKILATGIFNTALLLL